MSPAKVVFPTSSSPGYKPGEGSGALVNCYADKDGDHIGWFRSAGFTPFADTGVGTPRGFLATDGALYEARLDKLISVTSAGAPTTLTGTLSGSAPVSMARNNKVPTPDIAIVAESTAYIVSGASVVAYPDVDVGSPNSVAAFDGYLVFTYGSGAIVASDLNSTAINALSTAKAESNPDGLLRGVARGAVFYAMGSATIEPWRNAGTSPFPLARYPTVIPVGLFGQWAVAGFEDGWDGPIIFVASDGTVRSLNGFVAVRVSNRDVERDIQAVAAASTLKAHVYTDGGNAFWVLSSPTWTWEYNLTTEEWNQRKSFGLTRWRGEFSVKAFGRWVVGDTLSTKIQRLSSAVFTEDGAPLIARAEGVLKDFPARMLIPSLDFDFTVGQGVETGVDPIETAPQVGISVSLDGGASWSNPLLRKLGRQGQHKRQVRAHNLGRSTPQGVRVAWEISDPVWTQFRGATALGLTPRWP